MAPVVDENHRGPVAGGRTTRSGRRIPEEEESEPKTMPSQAQMPAVKKDVSKSR